MLLTKNGPRDMVNVSNSRECITMKYESMQQALEALKKLEQTQAAYNHAMGVLYLDATTAAPSDTCWQTRKTGNC